MAQFDDLAAKAIRIADEVHEQHRAVMQKHQKRKRKALIRLILAFGFSVAVFMASTMVTPTEPISSGAIQHAQLLGAFGFTALAALWVAARVLHHRLIRQVVTLIPVVYRIGQLVNAITEEERNGDQR